MIDMEKVIKGLECCANDKPFYHAHCDECSYNGRKPDNMGGCTKLYSDALELLKEKEPLVIHKCGFTAQCPECQTTWMMWSPDTMHYCPTCGRAVKWDE